MSAAEEQEWWWRQWWWQQQPWQQPRYQQQQWQQQQLYLFGETGPFEPEDLWMT